MKIFIVIIIVLIVLMPFISIWALNTLFGHVGLAIPYTIETWLASILLNGYFATPFWSK